jgi:hypothetical protein
MFVATRTVARLHQSGAFAILCLELWGIASLWWP